MTNSVFIATSLDGCIADKQGKLDWLNEIPNPDHNDAGYAAFMERMDAIVMGRNTYETVIGFDGEWPYRKPVFVLSRTLKSIPEKHQDNVELLQGTPREIIQTLHQKGHQNLYIDGGNTIQNFLRDHLIDEMIITSIPILLGGGAKLFGDLAEPIKFELVKSNVLLNAMVQNHYRKKS